MELEKEMVAFYISSHGFGHLTRSLVHIKKYLEAEKYIVYVVCGDKQIEFAEKMLEEYKDRVILKKMVTDIGLINKKNSLEVDIENLEKELEIFIGSWVEIVMDEIEFLGNKNIIKVITDISPIGMLVGNRLNVPVEAISNFTWYNQYNHLKLNEKIVKKFYEAEKLIDKFSIYPLALDLSHLECKKENIDYVCRSLDFDKIEKLKKEHENIVFISCGKSAELKTININNFDGTVFYTEGINVTGQGKHIKLSVDTEDTQNYIGASDFIICKAGWGTVAEGVIAKVPMVLLERDGVMEDTHIINELKTQKKAISINMKELEFLDMEKISKQIVSSLR